MSPPVPRFRNSDGIDDADSDRALFAAVLVSAAARGNCYYMVAGNPEAAVVPAATRVSATAVVQQRAAKATAN